MAVRDLRESISVTRALLGRNVNGTFAEADDFQRAI